MLNGLIDQCTSAVWARKAFFEKEWAVSDGGRIVYEKIAWRPPTSCEAVFDEKTAEPEGFKQWIGGVTEWTYTDRNMAMLASASRRDRVCHSAAARTGDSRW
jgi:hypothetical protein